MQLIVYTACLCYPSYPDKALGQWVAKQRVPAQRAKLTRKQKEKLNAVGFELEPKKDKLDKVWEEKLERLKEYQAEHGGKTVALYWYDLEQTC